MTLVAVCGMVLSACAPDGTRSPEPVQIEGVSVFTHTTGGGDDALHSGAASVRNGCLYIGDAVVVWRSDQLGQAEQLISSTGNGEEPQVTLPGGGVDVEEGPGALAGTVAQLCPTRVVWYTRPGA